MHISCQSGLRGVKVRQKGGKKSAQNISNIVRFLLRLHPIEYSFDIVTQQTDNGRATKFPIQVQPCCCVTAWFGFLVALSLAGGSFGD